MSPFLLRDVVRLIRGWWSVDRIRSCSTTAPFLAARPGDSLLIDGQLATILQRGISRASAGVRLRMECETEGGVGILSVMCATTGRLSDLTWQHAGNEQPLDADDVVILRRG